jgi:DNA-binding HxlR family transcriptional regulator
MMADESGLHDDCEAVHRVLGLLGRAWAGAVLWAMLDGADRFSLIRERLPGVSDAVLTARLRDLCGHGLAERVVEPGPPTSVRYIATPAGRDARRLLKSIQSYARRHPELF